MLATAPPSVVSVAHAASSTVTGSRPWSPVRSVTKVRRRAAGIDHLLAGEEAHLVDGVRAEVAQRPGAGVSWRNRQVIGAAASTSQSWR